MKNFLFLFTFVLVLFSCTKKELDSVIESQQNDTVPFNLFNDIKMSDGDSDRDKESMSLTPFEVEELLNKTYGKKFLLEKLTETKSTVYVLNRGTNGAYYVSGFYLKNGKIKELKTEKIKFWDHSVNIIGTK